MVILNNKKSSLENKMHYDKDWVTSICLSMIHALLDQKEKSIKYLSYAVEQGFKWGWHDFLQKCPIYKNYWDDPEFKTLVRQAQEERAAKRKQVQKMIERGEISL